MNFGPLRIMSRDKGSGSASARNFTPGKRATPQKPRAD